MQFFYFIIICICLFVLQIDNKYLLKLYICNILFVYLYCKRTIILLFLINLGGFMKNINTCKKIIVLSHCLINPFSKVVSFKESNEEFEMKKKELLSLFFENGVGILQLPCPETTCYGLKRWGHVKEQFDTPHFREVSDLLLKEPINQIEEYINNGFSVLGIIGINGSPSCGVDKTCSGDWYGEIGSNENLSEMISSIKLINEPGVLIERLYKLLEVKNLDVPVVGIDSLNIDEVIKFFKKKI